MPTTKRTTFEGQPSGTVATAANTGGGNAGSGDALALVTTGTGATTNFDNTHAWRGQNGLRIATGVTSALASFQHSLPVTDIAYCSAYCYLTSYNGGSSGSNAIRFRGAGTQAARARLNASGFWGISDTTTTNNVAMTGTAAPLNQWFRVDVQIRVTGGVGQAWLYVTNPDAPPGLGLHDDTVSTSGALYGSNPIDEIGAGQVAAAASVPDTWWDNYAVSDYALPGPDPGPQIDPTRLPTWTLIDLGARWARTWMASTTQASSGSATATQHSTTGATGSKGGTGPAAGSNRASTTTAGAKGATGSSSATARAATSATGIKGGTGSAAAAQRSTTTDLGAKGSIGTATALAHPTTADTGRKAATGSGLAIAHSTSLAPSNGPSGPGRTTTRAATTATGIKGAGGAARAITHPVTRSLAPAPFTPALVTVEASTTAGSLDASAYGGVTEAAAATTGSLDSTTRGGQIEASTVAAGMLDT